MKTLKTTCKLLTFTLLVIFASCKKDGGNNPSPADDISSIKGSYIAGRFAQNGIDLPYIMTFGENAKAYVTTGQNTLNGSYTYENGTLTIVYAANVKDVFTINNGTIINFTGASTLKTYSLQKTPETNVLNGNTYNGTLSTQGSNLFILEKIKFNATQYGESSLNDPTPNKDYTLINNASGTSNTGNNGVITFFVLIDGKLEMARYSPTNANGAVTISTGSLTAK